MLQTVVADDDVGLRVLGEQGTGGLMAVARYKNRCPGGARNQQGLVAYLLCARRRAHRLTRLPVAPKPARDHAHAQSPRLQVAHQRNHRGRFARATGHHIAHHDHKGVYALALEQVPAKQLAAHSGQGAIEGCHGQQRAGQRPLAGPSAQQGAGKPAAHGV